MPAAYAGGAMVLQELTREQRLSLVPEEAYRIFFTEAPEAALVLENETIVDCNDRALDLFGYEVKTEIVGKSTADLSPAQQPDGADSRRKMQDVIHAALQGARQTTNLRVDLVLMNMNLKL
jgi:PAS domain S-box-containing protein